MHKQLENYQYQKCVCVQRGRRLPLHGNRADGDLALPWKTEDLRFRQRGAKNLMFFIQERYCIIEKHIEMQ